MFLDADVDIVVLEVVPVVAVAVAVAVVVDVVAWARADGLEGTHMVRMNRRILKCDIALKFSSVQFSSVPTCEYVVISGTIV